MTLHSKEVNDHQIKWMVRFILYNIYIGTMNAVFKLKNVSLPEEKVCFDRDEVWIYVKLRHWTPKNPIHSKKYGTLYVRRNNKRWETE